ncbi:DUF2510 domain-containing protein [Nocardia australiensis]|uniref:DUF2510 domain-containing protein n=1 Tax=Nocardia australiensis TaxID=2887191 RepID=UPI001D133DF5|nr:DUF2510 domain-containing protein [Nocardia australiensis]
MGALSIWHIFILLILLVVIGIVVLIIKTGSSSQPGQRPPGGPAPGWYPDHADPALLRWFDGYQWTNQTQARRW